ncbi:putative transmembrane protein [Bifidobacterium saguini DSM 23967]|uniref:Uncharacterized protein n=3 Tax=Bifidobacterium TaxID=1678 RepID=A0A2N5ITU5_9BIFI|nr:MULTISPECIES: membrane protein [Bifidobacterium]KFI92825.1 putative transmembrane protein [Bifidobacterium saguini DSM 23967]PLS25361.1 hypothetical protein Tam1G_0563 [Bifidobacterium imperatoris]QSY58481.1 hypothetical protein BLI708_04195 [Bifidobacterium imperatoris]QTB91822.1 hypothetical protein BSD967_05350 [Bifidobacterium saguini]
MARVAATDPQEISAEAHAAWDELKANNGLTNMQQVLLRDYGTFLAYRAWHHSWDSLNATVGSTDATIFAHAISRTGSCLLCSLFFVSDLRDLGIDPNEFEPNERQQLLIDFAEAIVKNPTAVPDELFTRLRTYFNDNDIVVLVGFAGQMIAGNTFNSVLHVDVDGRLKPLEHTFVPQTWRDSIQ